MCSAAAFFVIKMNSDSLVRILIQFGLDDSKAKDAAQQIEELSKKTSESGEAAHHASEHHRAMHMVFAQMNQILPGLGHMMHAAFMGELGAIILVGEAVKMVQEKLKAFNDELDKQKDWDAQPIVDKWKAIQTEIITTIDDANKLAQSFKDVTKDSDPIATSIRHAKEAMEAGLEVQKKQVEAQYAYLEAVVKTRIELEKSRGTSTQDDENQLVLLENEKQNKLEQLEVTKTQFDFSEKQREVGNREIQDQNNKGKLEAGKSAYEDAKSKSEELKKSMDAGKDAVGPHGAATEAKKKADEDLAIAQEQIEADKKKMSLPGAVGAFYTVKVANEELGLPTLKQKVDDANVQYDIAKGDYALAQRQYQELSKAYGATVAAYDKLTKEAEENAAKLAQLNRDMPTATSIFKQQQASQGQVSQTEGNTQALDAFTKLIQTSGQTPAQITNAGITAAQSIAQLEAQGLTPEQAWKRLTALQQQQYKLWEDMLTDLGNNGQAWVDQIIRFGDAYHDNFFKFKQAIEIKIQQLENASKPGAHPTSS